MGVDLSIVKEYGPRSKDGNVYPGVEPVINGRDRDLKDSEILRFCYGRRFVMKDIIESMKYHFEWR